MRTTPDPLARGPALIDADARPAAADSAGGAPQESMAITPNSTLLPPPGSAHSIEV